MNKKVKIVLSIFLFIHGLIHFIGFAKAYDFGNLAQFIKEISRPMGLLWVLAGLLFIASVVLNLMKREYWPTLAILAVILSQILIFTVWTDAKYGTLVNISILIAAIIGYAAPNFEIAIKRM